MVAAASVLITQFEISAEENRGTPATLSHYETHGIEKTPTVSF